MVPDKSEVIYSLECCKQGKTRGGCAFCFYRHKGCFDALLSDAQSLLKDPEENQNRNTTTKEAAV